MKNLGIPFLLACLTLLSACQSPIDDRAEFSAYSMSETVRQVIERGQLNCGVSTGLDGFSEQDEYGYWHGIDADFCRGLAAVVLGDPTKVNFIPLTATQRFSAVLNREVDVLSRNSTWTLSRDTVLGIDFVGIWYFDAQSILVSQQSQVSSLEELSGQRVCVQEGTTSSLNLADVFADQGLNYQALDFPSQSEMLAAFIEGRCIAISSDRAKLQALKHSLAAQLPTVLLEERLSKEPIGPVVKDDDPIWFEIVQWYLFALITAEELQLTQDNIDRQSLDSSSAVRRFIGIEGSLGASLGLDSAWSSRAIKAVGNYAEIYHRNLGEQSAIRLPRDLNQLWSDGGLIYAPPMR